MEVKCKEIEVHEFKHQYSNVKVLFPRAIILASNITSAIPRVEGNRNHKLEN